MEEGEWNLYDHPTSHGRISIYNGSMAFSIPILDILWIVLYAYFHAFLYYYRDNKYPDFRKPSPDSEEVFIIV